MSTKNSDWGMKRLSTKELAEHVGATLQFGGNIAVFGRRGSGKTHISKQQIEQAKYKEIYINASVLERPDMGGYPDFRAVNTSEEALKKYIDFLLPGYYRHLCEGTQSCAVLLDEVDKADPSVWAPLLEFTQFHTMNGKKLPNLKAVIMTGNLSAEGGQRPCLPLLDRAEKYLAEADVNAFIDWAGKSKEIHPSITAYLHDNPEDLFGDVDPGEIYADPSPRGWHNASKILYFGEDHHWSNRILSDKVAGCIGKKAGIKYAAYFTHYQVLLPMIEKIFKGEKFESEFKKLEPSKQMVASMIVCARLARKLDDCKEGTAPKETQTISKFMNLIDSEMALIAIRSQIGLVRTVAHGLDEAPGWSELLSRISDRMA